jgi:4-hydroxyphenylpyruvate dioxygenase
LQIKRIHHVEFWVGNARQAAFFYRNAFGFSQLAYRGQETGSREMTSYALTQGKATLVMSTPLTDSHPAAEHVRRHGDGVRDIAFEVADADLAFEQALARGATAAEAPHDLKDEFGVVRHAAVHTYGDTVHSLLSPRGYRGPFLPGYAAQHLAGYHAGIERIDHVVGNVELGQMNRWADFYAKIFGFHRFLSFDDKDISTKFSALMSIVMSDDSYAVKFPINEPAPGLRKSQIDEFLEFYEGAGVQHIALQVADELAAVDKLQRHGVEFLRVPDSYYEMLPDRVGKLEEPLGELRRLGILVDKDEEGYLLQVFTRPVEDRPTLFYEIIQRKGSRGFGKGNFKALFEAIELEQARRGNL